MNIGHPVNGLIDGNVADVQVFEPPVFEQVTTPLDGRLAPIEVVVGVDCVHAVPDEAIGKLDAQAEQHIAACGDLHARPLFF